MKKVILISLLCAAAVIVAGGGKIAGNIPFRFDSLKRDALAAYRNPVHDGMIDADNPIRLERSDILRKGSARLPIARLSDTDREELLISSGIPFPPGRIYSDSEIAFYNDAGVEVPVAAKVLARWPQDDSVRSVLVQFKMNVPRRYKYLTIKWGAPKTTAPLQTIEVNWEIPEGIVLLPAEWLCGSMVTGEQVPAVFDRDTGPSMKYDRNIAENFQRIRDMQWTDDPASDNYYDTTHVFYQFYCRTGDPEYFKAARREAVHYRDKEILQDGPESGRAVTRKESRYIYVEAMVDDYLLTGDARSLETARHMAEYLKHNFDPAKAFYPRQAQHHWTERDQAFPFLGIITYYELTGEMEYFDIAKKYMINLYKTQNEWPGRGGFIHNLYSHDPEEGARRDEYGGSPFMTGLLLEPIVKYHRLTGSAVAKDSIFKALDWLMKEALAPDKETFLYTTADSQKGGGHPDLNMLMVHAFGYGYRISGGARRDYLELGRKLFERGAYTAHLGSRKHFNQNYRSSGHFLAYIDKEA